MRHAALAILAAGLTLASWGAEPGAPPPPVSPGPPSATVGSGGEPAPVSEEKLAAFRDAAATLGTSAGIEEVQAALGVLRDGFPESREVLHRTVESPSSLARSFAVRVLGEKGDVEHDLPVVRPALRDDDKRVRLAAVMALRNLGKVSMPALLEHLRREIEPNNRKMAIKTLQHWGDRAAVPDLVRALRSEKDPGVRNFLVTALEALTGQRNGADVAAWDGYVEAMALREQAEELMSDERFPRPETPPEVIQ